LKYHVVEVSDVVLIKVSGRTKNNEALSAKRMLTPYLSKTGVKVIVDLRKLEKAEPVMLLGVLNGIRREISLLRGELRLCSLKPDILDYFKRNRFDDIFEIYEDERIARESQWRNYGR
jgi:anti-anti-sigma factor